MLPPVGSLRRGGSRLSTTGPLSWAGCALPGPFKGLVNAPRGYSLNRLAGVLALGFRWARLVQKGKKSVRQVANRWDVVFDFAPPAETKFPGGLGGFIGCVLHSGLAVSWRGSGLFRVPCILLSVFGARGFANPSLLCPQTSCLRDQLRTIILFTLVRGGGGWTKAPT